jgi:hypothetical protein
MKRFLLFQVIVTVVEVIITFVLRKSDNIIYFPILIGYSVTFIVSMIIFPNRVGSIIRKKYFNLDYFGKGYLFDAYERAKRLNDTDVIEKLKNLFKMWALYISLFLFSFVYALI